MSASAHDLDSGLEMEVRLKRSETIERMRRYRAVGAPSLPQQATAIAFHPRLSRLAAALPKGDSEAQAFLVDLQVILEKCLLFVRAQHQARLDLRRRGAVLRSVVSDPIASKRGRREGAINYALRVLGRELAELWHTYLGVQPSPARHKHDIYGVAFADLVQVVMSMIPRAFRKNRKGHIPSIRHMVQQAVRDYHMARHDPNTYRRLTSMDGDDPWYLGRNARP